jgi:diaminohydroxyphosphoribosylaminopyrimidine deaminase/5-amino-6-(5-phosphoribosylamino)uracil reductase
MTDEYFMRLAIIEGEKGKMTSSPNPWVGCVIVKNNEIISTGFHSKAGEPHAEITAIFKIKDNDILDNSDIYITLEPCCHYGKTPPCTDTLLKYKFNKIIIALVDPDKRVSGNGIQILRNNGFNCVVGICEAEAYDSLQPYIYNKQTNRPYCTLKNAISLNGKIACEDGSSRYISNKLSIQNSQLLRANSDAILVGTNTVLIDNPELTIKNNNFKNPIRVILDTYGKIKEGNIFNNKSKTIMVTNSRTCSKETLDIWEKFNVQVIYVPLCESLLCMDTLLNELGKIDIMKLLIEGGGKLSTYLLTNNLVNEYILYINASLIGCKGYDFYTSEFPKNIHDKKELQLKCLEKFENDIKLTYLL